MFFDSVDVSASSWHYRWLQSWRVHYWRPPSDFCSYFWLVVFQAVVLIGISAFTGFLFAALVAYFLVVPWEALLSCIIVVGFLVFIIGFIGVFIYMGEVGNEKVANSLVGRFVRAKKNKYCPMINYTQ